MSSHCCSLLRYDTLYREMPVRLRPDTCLTLEGTRSSNLVALACSRRARVPVAGIGTRSGLVASVFPAPRFRQSESATSEGGSQWCPKEATGKPRTLRTMPGTLRSAPRSRFPNFAESVMHTTVHLRAQCPAASTQPVEHRTPRWDAAPARREPQTSRVRTRFMSLRETPRRRGAEVPNGGVGLTPATARRWNGLDRGRARTARVTQHDSCGMASRARRHGLSLQAEACSTFVALTSPDSFGRLLLSTSESGSSDPSACLESASATSRPLGWSERSPLLVASGGQVSLAQATQFSDPSGNSDFRIFCASAINTSDAQRK